MDWRATLALGFAAGCLFMSLTDADVRARVSSVAARLIRRLTQRDKTRDARDAARQDRARLVANGRLR
jgi:hypothetical protein